LIEIPRQRVHVSVQIEGTTNSNFLNELGKIYGANQVLVYNLTLDKFIRLSHLSTNPALSLFKLGKELLDNTSLFNSNPDIDQNSEDDQDQWYSLTELPPDTAAIHGLYKPSVFKGVLENPFISIILKNPLERLLTLYEEWTRNQGEVEWRVNIPYKKNLNFNTFALKEEFINYQSKCLGSRRLGDFDLVGVAECQDGFIAQLKNQDWTGYLNQKSVEFSINKPKYKKHGITAEFLKQFQELNQMDYAIYQQAKEFMGFCE
jgi:hypothetical protein